MFLSNKQMAEASEVSGQKVYTSKMAIAGVNGGKLNFTYTYKVWRGTELIAEEKGLLRQSNYHRAALLTMMEVMLTVIADSGKIGEENIFIRFDTASWNIYDAIGRGTINTWVKHEGEYNALFNTHNNPVKNQDLWLVLIYLAQFVTLGLIETDTTGEEYKEMHKKAKDYYLELFPPNKRRENLNKHFSKMSKFERLRKKEVKAIMRDSGHRRKAKNKLKELSKLI